MLTSPFPARGRRRTIRRRVAFVSLIVIGLVFAAVGVTAAPANSGKSTAIAVETVTASVPMPVRALVNAATSDCANAPGPQITLSGELSLGGLSIELLFKNNVKGTHTYTTVSTASVVVIPEGEQITIPKQPVWGGTGGNPFIWLEFTDADGNALGDPVFLGRCVQGLFVASGSFVIPSLAVAHVMGGSCGNQGSSISLSGELLLSGLNAKLLFQNNDNPVGGPHRAESPTTVSIVLIPAGTTITFPKSPALGGAGGNPWIFLEFLDANGNPVSSEFLLGRCVQDF